MFEEEEEEGAKKNASIEREWTVSQSMNMSAAVCEKSTNVMNMNSETQMASCAYPAILNAQIRRGTKQKVPVEKKRMQFSKTFRGHLLQSSKVPVLMRASICVQVQTILSLLSPIVRISPSSSPFGWHRASILLDLLLSPVFCCCCYAVATKTAIDTKLPSLSSPSLFSSSSILTNT